MPRSMKPAVLLAVLTALNFLNYFDRFILASVAEIIGKRFILSDTEIGTLSTAFMLGYFLTSPFFGFLGDRLQRKWLIAFGIFIWSLATFLTGYAESYSELIFYRVLVGIGEASYATVSPALIADYFPETKRNKALTIFYVAIPLGAAFGTLFGSYVGQHYGWEKAFMLAGAPGLIFAFSLLPFKEKRADSSASGAPQEKPRLGEALSLLKIRDYNLIVWGYVAYAFALGAYQYWGQVFLQRTHNLTPSEAGSYLGGVMVITGLIGTFVGGFISTRLQNRTKSGYALLCGFSVLAAFPFCILFTLSSSLLVTQISLAIAMLFLFMPTGPVNTIILDAVPANLRASAIAISIFAIHAFGDLWSPLIVGRVSDYFLNIQIGLITLLPAVLLCAVFWLKLAVPTRRTR
jgi:MFS family permease